MFDGIKARISGAVRTRPWLDHLVRAGERYLETNGNHYAAAITYFSMLALVPLLMIAFASFALVLQSNPDLLARLQQSDAPVERRLDPAQASACDARAVSFNEASFRYALNDDAMATEKLAEGIRAFAADARALDDLIRGL